MIGRNKPTVTIVMPTYNRAHLLLDTIASVLNQDYSDLELLVVDDGSTDSTGLLLDAICRQDERVQYLPVGQNYGISYARNYGIKRAKGRYIAMIDSDDHWLPTKLSTQVRIMENHPAIDFLFADYMTIGADYNDVFKRGFELTAKGMSFLTKVNLEKNLWLISDGLEKGILISNFIATSTIFVRSSVIKLTNGYTETIRFGEDIDLCWRAALFGAKFAYWTQVVQYRRVHSDSVTQGDPIEKLNAMLYGTKVLRETAVLAGRNDLIPYVKNREQHIWQKMLSLYASQNQKREALKSYCKSLRYGFSFRTLLVFVTGLIRFGSVKS